MAKGMYKKKAVCIEAVLWDGLNVSEIKNFCGDQAIIKTYDAAWKARVAGVKADIYIKTLEGDHHASVGDYIIKGVHGEFYPCKPDIFSETYEKVESLCEYCTGAKPLMIGNGWDNTNSDYGAGIVRNRLSVWGYDIHGSESNGNSVEIKYCPMCGRALSFVDNYRLKKKK